jgi:DNA-binding winged helix-turn-helix (wHTH) protein/Tol biopolymer transport system component
MNDLYKLGEYEIDVKRRQIRRDGRLIPLPAKPFEVLLILISRPGVVTKDELMQAIWPDAIVEESNLTQSVFLLRKALTETASASRYIITLPGIGYQLGVAPIPVGLTAAAEPPQPPVPTLNNPFRRTQLVVAAVFALIVAVLATWVVRRILRPAPFSNLSIRRLTNSGDIQLTAISLSGRYVAFVAKDAQGRESLSVLELRSGNAHVILNDAAIVFENIVFSPDESYLYYRDRQKQDNQQLSSEHRIPLLGGEPTLVVQDLDGPVAFIDRGQRLCFFRGSGDNDFAILSADADSGKNERILAKGVGTYPHIVVCSPDGQRAALSAEVGGITLLDFKTGQRRPFYESPDSGEIYADLAWKADGSGLLANAITPFNFYPSLVVISYPGAIRTQITHDLDSYQSPGITADDTMIVARQGDAHSQFESFTLPLIAFNPENISFPWSNFLGWRSDDEIVGSTTSGGLKLKNLTTGQETSIQTPNGMKFLQPNGCGASYLVATGGHPADKNLAIWRMNADGSNLKQLSHGPEDILATCTPDGKWVVYADNSFLHQAVIYRVSLDGGKPQKLGEGSVWFALSHHGDRVAWIKSTSGQQSLVLADINTGRQTATLSVPSALHAVRSITFTPDDRSVFCIARGESADSVYELPLDGSAPTKQVEFRGAHLATLMVSPTGKYLGAVTAKPVSDAVLLEEHPR